MRWRKEAFERLPEFRNFLQKEKSPHNFVGDLILRLEDADKEGNRDLIQRIYGFVFWCMEATRGKHASTDLPTIVSVSFLEHLPNHERIRRDVGNWFCRAAIVGMKEIYLYHGSEEEYQEMIDSCDVKKL